MKMAATGELSRKRVRGSTQGFFNAMNHEEFQKSLRAPSEAPEVAKVGARKYPKGSPPYPRLPGSSRRRQQRKQNFRLEWVRRGGDQYRGRSRRVVRGAVPHGSEQEPGEKDSQRTRVLSPCTKITSLEEEVEGRTLEATVSEGVWISNRLRFTPNWLFFKPRRDC